jgi:phosphohistidine phosphatase SixA
LDIRTTRELALQISGIGKIVYSGSRRHQATAEPVRASGGTSSITALGRLDPDGGRVEVRPEAHEAG